MIHMCDELLHVWERIILRVTYLAILVTEMLDFGGDGGINLYQ
jgi:hypothetical protein